MNKKPVANLEFVREDDFVEYYIFPKLETKSADDDDEDELRQQLEAVKQDCMQLVQTKIAERSYIWHKDEFQLQSRTGSAQELLLNDEQQSNATTKSAAAVALPPHLHGVTHYGDNIADEWFVVYLISELTRALPHCIARVCDADGEFLLIEAADVLPNWANPDTCEQRVYIAEGVLQLVQNSPSNTAKLMPVANAVDKIRLNSTLYRVTNEIQACIDARLEEFKPAKALASLHRQIVQLPLNAAALLKQRPALIASAVRAFCDRDTLDTKALRTMRYFPPESQRVRTNVTFTRCLYAMMMHTQYTPERRLGWNLSTATNTETYKEELLGIKIASGLEILAAQAKNGSSDQTTTETREWRAYLRSLTAKGYFRDNLEGSVEYKSLLEQAQSYFKANQARFRTAPLVGAEILELLHAENSSSAEQLRDEENNLQPSDSDAWLNISAEDLDAMLQERYGPKKLYKPNGDMNAAEFTKQLSDFLEKQSNFEGVETFDALDSDDDSNPDDDDDDDNDVDDNVAAAGVARNAAQRKRDFNAKVKKNNSMRKACQQNPLLDKPKTKQRANTIDPEEENASTHVRNFLDFVIPEDNWDSTSEMSDYEDEHDMERNLDAMSANAGFSLDKDIRAYMEQMDRELANTNVGQTFRGGRKSTAKATTADEDDFDDIEDFEPININVNTLKNMLDSYKSQIGGAGPVTNLFNAMGVGMSAAAATTSKTEKDELSESTV